MHADPMRVVMFVEGNKDERFWLRVVPIIERRNAVVYTIDNVSIFVDAGGQRERLIKLAELVSEQNLSHRFLFFVDADFDRFTGRALPDSVIMTDFRDLESYGLVDHCTETLCRDQFAKPDASIQELRELVDEVGRALAAVRLASHRNGLNLPFSETFKRDGGKRFSVKVAGSPAMRRLEIPRLIAGLLNPHGRMADAHEVTRFVDAEVRATSLMDLKDVVHGKDLCAILSWYFETSFDVAQALLFGAIYADLPRLRLLPRLADTEAWVRQ
ncbi:hypothetical protein ABIC32_001154 [Brevundimonas sp. 1080]|uniref:DUF4435 domain-containing protein n=1 Tax=Brevundimonas sp. 1080 TaxID=3156405 RepID=UPI00339A459D